VGVGGAFLAAGGVTGLLAMNQEKKLRTSCPNKTCDEGSDLKQANTQATLSTIFFGVGGAAVVTGAVLLLTGTPSQSESARRSITPQIGLGTVGVSGRF
jgi:hypothetical protein